MSQNNELLACYKILSFLEKASDDAEAMLDQMPGVMAVLNKRFQVVRGNYEFAELAGCNADDILGFDFTSLFSPAHAEKLVRRFSELTKRPEHEAVCFELEIQPREQGQETRQYYWQASTMRVANGAEGTLINITGKDLTDLYRSEMKLKNIYSNMALGMLTLDSEGRIKDVLSQFCEVIFNSVDLPGKRFISLFKNAELGGYKSELDKLATLNDCFGKSKAFFNDIVDKLPRVVAISDHHCANIQWANINYQPILADGLVAGFVLMIEDATEIMKAKQEIERVTELERQAQAVYEAAIRDPLTGLYTRLFMKESMKSLTSSFRRGVIDELAVLMMDIDHFKMINDIHGHKVGDSILSEVGRIILKQIRETDIAIRFGGEEFLLILPSSQSGMSSAKFVAERIRQEVEQFRLHLRSGVVLSVTISAGASWCGKNERLDTAIERADGCLYQAKRLGRNRTIAEGDF